MMRLLALGFLLVFTNAGWSQQANPADQGIVIVAEGRVSVAPDVAIVDAGVVTEGKTADDALSKNRPAMNRIREMARQFGVDAADLTTSHLSISPKYTQPIPLPNGTRAAREIEGYEARTAIKIVSRDLGKTGPLVDALVKSGSNSISNVRFALADEAGAKNLSRRKAAEAAKQQASLYAEALGIQLGDLISIREEDDRVTGDADLPQRLSRAMPNTVIEPGQINVTTSVKTVWHIKR